LFNSRFKFYAGQLASRWQGPLVVQEVYRSRAIRLHGDYKGKSHVVNGQRLKHYIAGEKFIENVEELHLCTPEAIIADNYPLSTTRNQ
jgi:hypothetical protein